MKEKIIHILIISQYFPPDISGGSTRAFNYAKCLKEQNYKVTVITAPPHQHAPVPKNYRGKLMKKEKEYDLDLIRVWIPSLLHSSIRNSSILNFSFLISCMFPIFSIKPKPDIIFAFEPNLFSIIPAFFYSKLRGGKVIRAIDDLWPELLYDRGIIKSKLIKKILNNLAKFSYTYPKFLFPLNDAVKEIIQNSYDISDKKIKVISHGVDTNIFTYFERKREINFILLYSGSLVESYDFDIIINAAKKLQGKNFKFIIRGRGKLLDYIVEKKKKLNLNNLIINSEFVSLKKLPAILGDCDVLLAPMGKGHALNFSLPTKILEYQAVGRPILCCSNGAIGKYVETTKSGIRTEQGDLDSFIESILKLESDPNMCKSLGENGRMYIEKFHSFEKIKEKFSYVINQLLI